MRNVGFTEGARQILVASQCRMDEELERLRPELQSYRDRLLPAVPEEE